MFRCIVLAFLASSVSSAATAQSGVITDAYIGCLTEDNLSQLERAISSGDTRLRDSMMGKVCVVVQGYEYSMLDAGILTSTIRVYVNDASIDLIVPSEAVRK